ncbi:MAG: hypothetical protein HQK97_06850 [Nitrospirae bacterium]|nr:hypothetical protein [Nitrospirota bacterium]
MKRFLILILMAVVFSSCSPLSSVAINARLVGVVVEADILGSLFGIVNDPQLKLKLKVELKNNGTRDLKIKAVTYVLRIDGQEIGRGDKSFDVSDLKAGMTSTQDFPLVIDAKTAIFSSVKRLIDGKDLSNVNISGDVTVSTLFGDKRLPYDTVFDLNKINK